MDTMFKVRDSWMSRFDAWLTSRTRNTWIRTDEIPVYVRKSQRVHPPGAGTSLSAVDIASVSVREDFQGKGLFAAIIACVETEARSAGYEAVYVESVLSDRFVSFLQGVGYVRRPACPSDLIKVL